MIVGNRSPLDRTKRRLTPAVSILFQKHQLPGHNRFAGFRTEEVEAGRNGQTPSVGSPPHFIVVSQLHRLFAEKLRHTPAGISLRCEVKLIIVTHSLEHIIYIVVT
jgi:hypothetical protein